MKINQYLHAADSEHQIPLGDERYDPLLKVWPILDVVCTKCKELYKPTCAFSIDEAMVGFNGRLHFQASQLSMELKFGVLQNRKLATF